MSESQKTLLKLRQIQRHKEACLRAAEDYIQRGWSLIPLEPGGKRPFSELLPMDKDGNRSWTPFAARPATLAEVYDWFDRYPDLNLGVICGQASRGLVVVDYDKTPSDMPPKTPIVRTSRGFHAYYYSSQPIKSTKFEFGDILAEGKIAVIPPSFNSETGHYYTWYSEFSLHDVEIADFKLFTELNALQEDQGENKRSIYTRTWVPPHLAGKSHIRTWVPPLPKAYLNEGRLKAFLCVPEIAIAIMEKCGVHGIKLGKAFRCPLPGHNERHASAALFQTNSGEIWFHDFHNREGLEKPFYTVSEVYRAVHMHKCECSDCLKHRRLKATKGEQALWLVKALVDIGLLSAPEILAPKLPEGTPDSIRDVYRGFLEVLALHRVYNPKDIGAPYSYRFAHRWTGRGIRQCKKAIQWLTTNGYMRLVRARGEYGCKSAIWTVGNGFSNALEKTLQDCRPSGIKGKEHLE